MANKPLKSLTFPGLSDTYTVPQVDNTLAVSGAAADAKKTGDELTSLKQDISEIEQDGQGFLKGNFINGSLSNGVVNTAITYRVTSDDKFVFNRDIILTPDSGYRFGIHSFGTTGESFVSDSGWKTASYTISAGVYFKIVIQKTEVTSGVANISEYVHAVKLSTFISDLDDRVNYLKNAHNNLVEELDFVDYGEVYAWVIGVLDDGEVDTSVDSWKTLDGYIPIAPNGTIRVSHADASVRFSIAYAYYDDTYAFTSGDVVTVTGNYDLTNNTDNLVYIKVSCSKTYVDGKSILIESTVNMLTRLTSLENDVDGLTGNVSTLNSNVSGIKSAVSSLSDDVGVQTPLAIYGYEEDTLLKNDGGTRSNTSYNTTSYISIANKKLSLSVSTGATFTCLLCFYNSEKTYISDTFNTYNITGEFEINPPSSAKYVRLSISKTHFPNASLINKNGIHTKVDELTEQIPDNNIYKYSGLNIRQNLSTCYIENSEWMYPQAPTGTTKQGIAYYDGVLFQFLADDACEIIDTTTNTLIGTVTTNTGHSNTASFSNEFYDSGDRFPLCYVAATIDSTNIVKVLRFTNDFTVQLIRTLTLPYETFGYVASIAFDRITNKYYSLANKESSASGHISTCVLCELSVDNMTEVTTGVYAPTLVSKKEVTLPAGEVYYHQGFKVLNGLFYLVSGGASVESKAFMFVISFSSAEVINVFNNFPAVIANSEFEDLDFVANNFIATYNIILHARDKGYYKVTV